MVDHLIFYKSELRVAYPTSPLVAADGLHCIPDCQSLPSSGHCAGMSGTQSTDNARLGVYQSD